MKIIFLILASFLFILPLKGQHSIGVETGINIYGGTIEGLNKEKQTLTLSIPYEYHWTKKSSFIVKLGYSHNSDVFYYSRYIFNQPQTYETILAKTEFSFLRTSFLLSRKFGYKRKIYGVYKLGVGIGFIINGNYYIHSQLDDKLLEEGKIKPGSNTAGFEFFSEFSLGIGWKINEKYNVELNSNFLIGLNSWNYKGESILANNSKHYRYNPYYEYRTQNVGFSLSLIRKLQAEF